MDPHLRGQQPDAFDERERLFSGQRRRGGFFGRPRQEFFHKRSFAGVSMDGFINMLNDYMVWYRDRRIKTEFGMSIMDRRRELGLVA